MKNGEFYRQRKKNNVIGALCCIFFVLVILSVNSISAFKFDDKIDFHKNTNNSNVKGNANFGSYEIYNSAFLGFGKGEKEAKYTLIENSYSIFTAKAIINVELFKDEEIIADLNLYNKDNKKVNDIEIKKYISWNEKVKNYKEEYIEGKIYSKDNYTIILEAKRNNKETGLRDWIITTGHGDKELINWADWWDTSWKYKKQISNLSGSIIRINVTYDSDMQSDFDDVRFTNSSEDTELGYWLEQKADGSSAIFRVRTNGETSIYMYYGNDGASSNSNVSEVYGTGLIYFFPMENSPTGNLTNVITENDDAQPFNMDATNWVNGKIGKAIKFDGGNEYLSVPDSAVADSVLTVIGLGNFTQASTNNYDRIFIAKATDYTVGLDLTYAATGRFFKYTDAGTASEISIQNTFKMNSWNSFTLKIDGSNMSGWVNGRTYDTASQTSEFSNANNWYIGGGGANRYYTGQIDEVMMWNRALTDGEISIINNSKQPQTIFSTKEAVSLLNITLNNPINNYNSTSQNITFNCSSTAKFGVLNLTLIIDGVDNYTIYNSTSSQNLSLQTELILSQGFHNWTCKTSDEYLNVKESNRTLFIDSIIPIINITYPIGTINYFISGNNLSLNWSITETNLDSIWYNYNGTNVTLYGATNSTYFKVLSSSNKSLIVYANDTFGNVGNSTTNWDYKIFQTGIGYNNETIEGTTEKFNLNFTKMSSLTISMINLIYNSTSYSSTYSLNNDNVTISRYIAIPNFAVETNNTFYFNIIFTDESIVNTSSYNQTVNILGIDNCSSYSTLIYNYTLKDEETQENLDNGTIEIQLSLYDSSRSLNLLNYSQSYENFNPAQVCLSTALLNSSIYSIDSIIKYTSNESNGSVDYALEYYNILNFSLTNDTIPQNISLYNLKTEDSTDFQLTFKDSTLAFFPNALIYVYRQYVSDGDYKIVEIPITDSNGQTVLHLVRNDILYNFVITDISGEIIASFNKVIAFCQDYTIGSCTINLNARSSGDSTYKYTEDLAISYSQPTYSNITDLVSFSFVSSDLSTKTISTKIIRNNPFGNRTVCENSITSATGTLTCNVSDVSSSDRFLFIDILVNGDLKAQEVIDLESDISSFGVNGFFYAFLIILFIITLFMNDKQTLVIAIGLGWIIVISLSLLNGALIGSLSAGVWLITTIMIYLWKLNKEENP